MKRLLLTLLVLISLGLCAVCVVQWQREARLRGHITDLVKRLEAENAARVEAERKVKEYEKEIERLTELRAEVGGLPFVFAVRDARALEAIDLP
jgi:hypothetical protein